MAEPVYYDPDNFPECVVTLASLNGTFPTKRVAVPDGKIVVFGRLPADSADIATVPRFQSKVVSRQHCIISNQAGRFFLKDAGSSSGTFLAKAQMGDKFSRLSEQAKESPLFELNDGDIIQLGEDYDQGGVFHKCTQMRISLPTSGSFSQYSASPVEVADSYEAGSGFIDYSTDPDVRREVEDEFNALWASLTSPLTTLTPRGSSFNQRKVSAERKDSDYRSSFVPSAAAAASPPPAAAPAAAPAPSPAPTVDGVNPNDCIVFIQSLTWDSPGVQARLVELVQNGDTHILGFYRSLKQFPSAFKDVVTKYVQKKATN